MIPATFEESNKVIDRPKGMSKEDCDPLCVYVGATKLGSGERVPVVVSCWKMTPEELQEFNRTGRVYLICVGGMMPSTLSPLSPFEHGQEEIELDRA